MGFALPSGVVNTDSLYIYASDATTIFDPFVKELSDQTLVIIDYSQLATAINITSIAFAVDVSSNPNLVVSYPTISPAGNLITFLLSGGITEQQYRLAITVQYFYAPHISGQRSDLLVVNIPPSGDCGCETINPVPALYNQVPLWGGGYINSAVRLFWSDIPPNAPNALDQWFNTTTNVLSEWMTDGMTAFWSVISAPDYLHEAPNNSTIYGRYSMSWVPVPIQLDAPNDGTAYARKSVGWSRLTHSDITDWATSVIPVTVIDTAPASPLMGQLWWDSVGGQLYIWYSDGTSAEWVSAVNQAGGYLSLSGGAVSGPVDLKVQAVTATPTTTINRTQGENVTLALGVNVSSLAVVGWPTTGFTGKVRLTVTNGGSFAITGWPAGTMWPGGTLPVITSGVGKKDIILLMSDDGGATIFGSIVGQDYR